MKDIEQYQPRKAEEEAAQYLQGLIICNYSRILALSRRTPEDEREFQYWKTLLRSPEGYTSDREVINDAEAEVDSFLRQLEEDIIEELACAKKAQSQTPKRYKPKKEELRLQIKRLQGELASVRYLLNTGVSR